MYFILFLWNVYFCILIFLHLHYMIFYILSNELYLIISFIKNTLYMLTVIKYCTYIFLKIKSTSIKDSKQIVLYKCCIVHKYFFSLNKMKI